MTVTRGLRLGLGCSYRDGAPGHRDCPPTWPRAGTARRGHRDDYDARVPAARVLRQPRSRRNLPQCSAAAAVYSVASYGHVPDPETPPGGDLNSGQCTSDSVCTVTA